MVDVSKRRTDRVLISLPVSVSGTDASGTSFSEDTTTVTVSQHGAAIALNVALAPGQEITLRRQRTRVTREAECHVVGQIGQQAVVIILNAIYEEDFLGFSYGFRPGRSQHQVLDALWVALTSQHVNYILDADIRGFFNYHAVPGNLDGLWTFRYRLTLLWRTQLRQRSQRHSINWDRMGKLVNCWLPEPPVLHPWPFKRFAATHPS